LKQHEEVLEGVREVLISRPPLAAALNDHAPIEKHTATS